MPGTGYDKDAAPIGSLFQGRPRSHRWLFLGWFIVSILVGMLLATLAKGQELVGPITHVTDGDTIRLCQAGRCQSIRLCGINAPEAGEPDFQGARAAMQRLVANTTIVCRPVGQGTLCDGRSPPKSHDRIVAQCFTPAGKDIAAELLRTGLACECTNYSGGRYRAKACPPGTSGCGKR